MHWLDYFLLIISVLLILIIVLQNSKDDVSKAFSGEKSENAQKHRGFEKVISNVTSVLSGAFFIVALLLLIVL